MINVVKDFLEKNASGYFATIDGEKPRVRPFQYMLEKEGKLYFCTANTKEVYKQLQKNPWVEFSSTSSQMETIRISGQVQFDNNMEVKDAILKKADLVRSLYKTPENPIFEVFYLDHADVIIADFSGQPPKRINF